MDDLDTSGYYKKDGDFILFGTVVLNAAYELRKETKDQHTYPVDGWSWFDSEAQAKAALL